jgi:TRAP-type mannitol/chloroaromatic compound transport system substrate-binding protein
MAAGNLSDVEDSMVEVRAVAAGRMAAGIGVVDIAEAGRAELGP